MSCQQTYRFCYLSYGVEVLHMAHLAVFLHSKVHCEIVKARNGLHVFTWHQSVIKQQQLCAIWRVYDHSSRVDLTVVVAAHCKTPSVSHLLQCPADEIQNSDDASTLCCALGFHFEQ